MWRLNLTLDDDLLPVQYFFNSIPYDLFMQIMESFSKGIGAGFESCSCDFPGDLDAWEEPINGIMFTLGDEEVIIPYDKFLEILELSVNTFIESHENKKDEALSVLEKVKIYIYEDISNALPGDNVI